LEQIDDPKFSQVMAPQVDGCGWISRPEAMEIYDMELPDSVLEMLGRDNDNAGSSVTKVPVFTRHALRFSTKQANSTENA
jgi:hypothetical protein